MHVRRSLISTGLTVAVTAAVTATLTAVTSATATATGRDCPCRDRHPRPGVGDPAGARASYGPPHRHRGRHDRLRR